MSHRYQEKIVSLWIVFLLGLLFHTQLGLMPLFHGLDVVATHSQSMADIAPIMWLMLVFFTLPMAAIVGTVMNNTRRYRTIHFGVTLLYTMLNFSHLVADLVVQPIAWYQIALMVILIAIGLLINVVSFQWMQDIPHKHLAQKMNV